MRTCTLTNKKNKHSNTSTQHTHTHTLTHSLIRAHAHARTHTRMHARTHIRTHSLSLSLTHTYTHTHTNTQASKQGNALTSNSNTTHIQATASNIHTLSHSLTHFRAMAFAHSVPVVEGEVSVPPSNVRIAACDLFIRLFQALPGNFVCCALRAKLVFTFLISLNNASGIGIAEYRSNSSLRDCR